MRIVTTGASASLSLLFLSVLFCSCQRDLDDPEPPVVPPPVVVGTVDSTQLIKSITWLDQAIDPRDMDSTVETYQYDTINHKIRLSWEDKLGYWLFGTSAEISYNEKKQATGIQYTYPIGYSATDEDYESIAISYDVANVLNKIVVKYGNGNSEDIQFTKTSLDKGKYQLEWKDLDPSEPKFTVVRKASFDAAGKNILNIQEQSYPAATGPGGEDIYSNHIVTDSMAYDGAGNVNKIFRTIADTLLHSKEEYVDYEFTGRMSKGDQLFKQRELLLHGFANIPFIEMDDFISDAFGVLSFSFDAESLQYSQYPAQGAKVHFDPAEIKNFVGGTEFDATNRLTKFKWFFRDLDLVPETYIIKYYK